MDDQPLLTRVLLRLTSPPLLTGLTAVLVVGSALMVLAHLLTVHGPTEDGHIAHGDFLAFWTGARMVWEGHGAHLYDLDAQHALQLQLLGPAIHEWQPYVNPPLLALALAPLGALDFSHALWVFAGLSTTALVVALGLLRAAAPELLADRRAHLTAALVIASFPPLARVAAGGQNTSLTLALLVGLWVGLSRERPVLAGICLGLLTYKPQYGLLLLPFVLLRRAWLTTAVAAGVSLLHLGAATWTLGWGWWRSWAEAMVAYAPLERASNGHTHIALLPWLRYPLGEAGTALALALGLVVVAVVLRAARRPPLSRGFALALTGSMLISPHLQYYDVAVLALPLLLGLDARGRRPVPPWLRLGLALAWLGYPLYALAPWLGFQPLGLWLVLGFAWLAQEDP